MKGKSLLQYLSATVALGAATAFAGLAPGTGVIGSVHDMTLYHAPTATTDPESLQGRVCSYCHTPHHALDTGNEYLPLWSHRVTTTAFSSYGSATIDATIDTTTFMEGPSKLCMSCHDGSIAVDTHYNFTGTKLLQTDDTRFNTPSVGRNGLLSNDHPVGFVYDGVLYPDGVATGPINGNSSATAHVKGKDEWVRTSEATYIGTTLRIADRLYASPVHGGRPIMTCATCHDVHNRKSRESADGTNYLLLVPNNQSQLCLSCHIK